MSDEFPWWTEVKGHRSESMKREAMSVAFIKGNVEMTDVLRHYGADLPESHALMPLHLGQWLSIKCPFHQDEKASGSLNVSENRFRCHGCDIGGDVIDVVREAESIPSVKETLQWISLHLL